MLRWVLFAVSAAGVGATAERINRRATDRGDLRFIGTGVLFVAVAVAEVLLAGTVGLGGNAAVITGVAVIVAIVTRLLVPASGPTSASLARSGWARLSAVGRVGLGAAAGAITVETVYLMFRSAIGTDGLISHLGEPAMWVTDGRPGSMHPTISGFAFEAYPKTGEVLFSWAIGTARTPVATTFVMIGGLVLLAVAAWSALRQLDVSQCMAVTIATSLALCPIVVTQVGGPNTDLFTLTWILCIAALCLGAMIDTGLLPIALVCGGVAVGTRTTAIPVVLVALAVAFWMRRRALLGHLFSLSLAAATTLGIGVVWYLQDLAVYHAPLYPFSSFPDGPPVPKVISALDANFLHDPRGALRVAHVSGYAHALGAGLVLAAGVVLTLILLPTVRETRLRRRLAVAVLASVAEAVIWSITPYTGYSGNPSAGVVYVLAGTRYLMPGVAIFAMTVGLATRAKGVLGHLATTLAIADVVIDVWALHRFQLGFRPVAVTILVAVLIGAAAGYATAVRRRPAGLPSLARIAIPGVLLIATIATATAATHGYLNRHITLVRQLHIDEPDVLAALDQQPAWHDGHLPVATGPVADALLAGPTFNHPLHVITQSWSCTQVQAAAREGWVILPSKVVTSTVPGVTPYDRMKCLADKTPRFEADGLSIYAP